MNPIGCRDEYRKGWLDAVEGLHHRLRKAVRGGDLEAMDGGIFDDFYDFHDTVLLPWTTDPTQSDTPPRMTQ